MSLKPHHGAPLLYIVLGLAWLWASPRLLAATVIGQRWAPLARTASDGLLVLASAGFVAALVYAHIRRLDRANQKLCAAYEQTMLALTGALDVRHRETGDHSLRVTRVMLALARFDGIRDPAMLKRIEYSALLHDIGKLMLPDSVLTKAGPLDEREMALVRRHPIVARELLQKIDFLCHCTDIPQYHHEHWDGTGYPQGLAGEDIPYLARLFAVVDVWDALTHPRVYKRAWSDAQVRQYLSEQAGKLFDPHAVALFLRHYEALRAAADARSLTPRLPRLPLHSALGGL
ncbi:HD domain-containing phosphohydrolase [Oleiagrimonas sp. C23AA]|uniref:HD-GYP domain-containing protein n=1 Tax=Oleiagrimonas sp. C23AA TaxID=2719047 RepID=UPI00142244CD|nr:HD domain-containing phosphohydrolase [Oleiagrimonas sp. C23AA]NII10541.1 HD domain-containing protein [Oleiagrimonas sp. C23AA]